MVKFIIPDRLPNLNDMIDAAKQGKRNFQPYAEMKRIHQEKICWIIKKLPQFQTVRIRVTWYEPNAMRDPDGIIAGLKFIMDSLVKMKVIPNDSQKYVKGIENIFSIDRDNPRIEVEITGVQTVQS
jgi:Holliday junction resolvase RusA-like endonuclease